jgi:uncharacterized membrane protein YkgB
MKTNFLLALIFFFASFAAFAGETHTHAMYEAKKSEVLEKMSEIKNNPNATFMQKKAAKMVEKKIAKADKKYEQHKNPKKAMADIGKIFYILGIVLVIIGLIGFLLGLVGGTKGFYYGGGLGTLLVGVVFILIGLYAF